MKERNTVVIFDGAETPFLLRPTNISSEDGALKFVGDRYLEGWMECNYFGFRIENLEDRQDAESTRIRNHSTGRANVEDMDADNILLSAYFTLS